MKLPWISRKKHEMQINELKRRFHGVSVVSEPMKVITLTGVYCAPKMHGLPTSEMVWRRARDELLIALEPYIKLRKKERFLNEYNYYASIDVVVKD